MRVCGDFGLPGGGSSGSKGRAGEEHGMSHKHYAVIMAGGKGERFWPLSTSQHPKQVLSLIGGRPMLARSIDYLAGLIPPERVIVVTSAELVGVTCEAVPYLPPENVVGEPFGMDTAAACALGSAIVMSRCPESAFCVLTADHVIGDTGTFRATLVESLELADSRDVLVTIGIRPVRPSTGFGYIETGDPLYDRGQVRFLSTCRFVEKPDRDTAQSYIDAGNYYWNSGMFAWSAASLQNALGKHSPEHLTMAESVLPAIGTPDFARVLSDEYSKLTKISIDYAVMEKAGNIVMARGDFAWDDIGSWTSMENYFEKDARGNAVDGSLCALDSGGNIVMSRDRLTALIGVHDLVVVHADGATLVCARERAEDVKKMVALLREHGDVYGGLL
jgi:mannose-1-phosphate guanylyltransferase